MSAKRGWSVFGLTNQYEAMLVLAKKELKQMQTMLEQVQQVRWIAATSSRCNCIHNKPRECLGHRPACEGMDGVKMSEARAHAVEANKATAGAGCVASAD